GVNVLYSGVCMVITSPEFVNSLSLINKFSPLRPERANGVITSPEFLSSQSEQEIQPSPSGEGRRSLS
ncbi:MAG: hypothetical protein LUB59_02015, partial [Candidatus Gastranaerophilales bacterium]|nr:hypothetical protein [Candidatus Gastranaerophilales bacterium]